MTRGCFSGILDSHHPKYYQAEMQVICMCLDQTFLEEKSLSSAGGERSFYFSLLKDTNSTFKVKEKTHSHPGNNAYIKLCILLLPTESFQKKFPYLKNHARSTHFWETKQMANTADSKSNEHRNRR